MGLEAASFCEAPHGFFANYGKSIGDDELPVPALSSLLWEGDLAAFGVDKLNFVTLNNGNLTVIPWVGDTSVNETIELAPEKRDCEDGRWRFTTSWDGLFLDGVVAGLLWTGGIFLPAAQRDEYNIMFTDDGDLAVRYIGRIAGTFFFFFPMYMKDKEIWFVYERIDPAVIVLDGVQ